MTSPSSLLSSSKKRYRSASDIYKGGASMSSSVDDELIPVWEWMAGSGEWIPFSHKDNLLIESAFTAKNEVQISSGRVVDFTLLQQRNSRTGRVRPIRRSLRRSNLNQCNKSHDSEPSHISGTVEFDGTKMYLNKLKHGESIDGDNGLTFADVIGDKSTIKSVFLSSFGTDIEWLLQYFTFSTPIVLVDDYDKKRGEKADIQQPFGEVWPSFRVVHPFFESGGQYDSGTMHAKLIMIERDNTLRICISSSNLTPQDWEGVSQCIWLADFTISDQETPSMKRVKIDDSLSFGEQLALFVKAFFRTIKDGPALVDYWTDLLTGTKFNVKLPPGIQLVASAPGYWKGDDRDDWGHMRLRKLLSNTTSEEVLFQCSSIGFLPSTFLSDFSTSLNCKGNFKVAWPLYDVAMWKKGCNFLRFPSKHFEGGQFPVKVLTPLWLPSKRKKYLCHSKVILSLPNDDWIYMGSHNLSQSAWGRLVTNGTALQVASYELGVFITRGPSDDIRSRLPFIPPSHKQECKPWPSSELPWLPDLFSDRVFLDDISNNKDDEILIESLRSSHAWAMSRGLCITESPEPLGSCLSKLNDGQLLMVYIVPSLDNPGSRMVDEYVCNTLLQPTDTFKPLVLVLDGSCPHWHIQHVRCYYHMKNLPAIMALDSEGSAVGEFCGQSEILQLESFQEIEKDYASRRLALDIELQTNSKSFIPSWKWVKTQGFNLLCFDVDGTITQSNTTTSLAPGVAEFFANLQHGTRVALVTNQGAVGLRYWMESGKFGKPNTLPDATKVQTRLSKVREQLLSIAPSLAIRVYVAYRYQSKSDPSTGKVANWGPCPNWAKSDDRWSKEWRKPNPGMLLSAMEWAGATRLGTLMVGDMQSDKDAAVSAGVIFRWAPEFFVKGEDLPQINDVSTIIGSP